jgi:protein kinase A
VLLDDRNHIRLTDFGLAREASNSNNREIYSFCGSPIYIAPETLSKKSYDKRADFYSLGILLYEMIVGYPPFNYKHPTKMKIEKLNKEIQYPSTMSSSSIQLIKMLV